MKFISWNINGIRAAAKKGLFDFLVKESPDFLCLQEIKAQEDQIPFDFKIIKDYQAFFNSGERKGYSGVAIYTKHTPINVFSEIGDKRFDSEGRHLILEYEKFFLCNVYFPNGKKDKERLQYKLDYYDHFLKYINKLKKSGKAIIFCGDVNTAHKEIDLEHPKNNENTSGFLKIEREWIDKLIENDYVDTFRHFNKEPKQYTWWDLKTRARSRNVGWRIDYFFIDKKHLKYVKDAKILQDVLGSDHCPITLEINFN